MWALGFIFRYQKSTLQCLQKSVSRRVCTLLVSKTKIQVYSNQMKKDSLDYLKWYNNSIAQQWACKIQRFFRTDALEKTRENLLKQ